MQVPLHNGGCESHSWYGSCISSTAGCLALAGERVRGAAPRGIVLAGWLPCLSARPDPTWVSLACLPAHMHTSTDAVVCGVRAGSCKRASACAAPRRAAPRGIMLAGRSLLRRTQRRFSLGGSLAA